MRIANIKVGQLVTWSKNLVDAYEVIEILPAGGRFSLPRVRIRNVHAHEIVVYPSELLVRR